MDLQTILTTFQNINWARAIHNYHARHYIWEIAKILVPVLLTGMITFTAMKIADGKNKKRWLNDGHIKRKTELEIELRRFLLGIKANTPNNYESLAEWKECDLEELNPNLIYNFNKNFESLVELLEKEENASDADEYHYKKIFALIDEYVYYTKKNKALFEEFKMLYNKIFTLKTIYQAGTSNSEQNIECGNVMAEIKSRPKHFDEMVNVYLCFLVAIERILKKLTVKKL